MLWHGRGVLVLCSPLHKSLITSTTLTTCNTETQTHTHPFSQKWAVQLSCMHLHPHPYKCLYKDLKPQKGRAHIEISRLRENHCAKKSKLNQQYCTVLLGHKHTPTHSAHRGLHTPTVIFQDLSQSHQIHFLEQQSFSYRKQAVPPLRLNLSEQPREEKRKKKIRKENNLTNII